MKIQLTEEQRANLTLWIEKLESGEYRQGTGKLRRGNALPEFCCLGVYADIKGAVWNEMLPSLFTADLVEIGTNESEYLKEDWFEEQIGLSLPEQNALADRNDGGQDFVRIAGALRRYLKTGDTNELEMVQRGED